MYIILYINTAMLQQLVAILVISFILPSFFYSFLAVKVKTVWPRSICRETGCLSWYEASFTQTIQSWRQQLKSIRTTRSCKLLWWTIDLKLTRMWIPFHLYGEQLASLASQTNIVGCYLEMGKPAWFSWLAGPAATTFVSGMSDQTVHLCL